MNEVTGRAENGILIISLFDRVTSTNAAEVEAAISAEIKKRPVENLIVDADKLEYISSAGLRIILRLKKQFMDLKIINVSSEVYDVLEMTGFSEILTVEKAYRKLSIDGCEVIGQGANGVVYRLDPDTIIKVYRNPDSLSDIKRERELARKAFVLGIPTAIPYDVVRVGNGFGSVFELLNAKSFAKLLKASPENIDTYVHLYIDVLKKLNTTEVKPDDMPDIKTDGLEWARFMRERLPAKEGEKLYKLISDLPDCMTMVHGDYHIKNIMMQNGEVLLIDMDTLSHGHPLFELEQMYLSYVGYGVTDKTIVENFFNLPYSLTCAFWDKSIREYLGTDDINRINEVEDKIKVLAYTRLVRRMIRKGGDENAIREYTKKLTDLVNKLDTLEF